MSGLFGAAPAGETVQLRRAGKATTNAHGQVISGAHGAAVNVPGVIVDQPVVSEPRDGIQNVSRADYQLFFPEGFTVGKDDVVIVRGHVCQVEEFGEPLMNAFTGAVFRTEVMVRRTDETGVSDG